ncbi:unnamed protein product [Diatraea saccharalis]|uniref:Piezo TM1-24 domain-containing protein n=1 Tax=Diatraea saccharalis TaxID=40085 RepID=A0A9N9QVJ7_9NEOP|nr:unnamed protein product [Diatraea saccharalis]
MAKYYIAALLFRVVLPAGLLLSIALRPFGLSVIYLLLYLLAPLVIVPDTQTFSGGCRTYLLLTLILSFLLLLTHAAWHSVLAAFAPYGSLLKDYPIIQKIGHNLGLVSYAGIDPQMAVHYLAPELVMSGVSLLVYLLVKKLLTRNETGLHKKDSKHQRYPLLTSAGKYVCLFLIMFSGIMRPSISSGIYFLVFMGAATAWAVGRPLEKGFAVVSRCVMAIMAVHIAILVAYQCSWLIEIYPPEMDFARYFGLTKLVSINETTPTSFTYEVTRDQWATIASPLVILLTYFILAIETRELFKPKLIKSMSPSKRWSSIRSGSQSKQLHQDSTGSVVIPDEESAIEGENTLLDDIVAAIVDFFQVLVRSSYIATTITMMAWSIMFHSWLTFVFLMWANIVWLCQDQRSFMLKTSPVLVCYAMLLLLTQYIYGMNLLETELPSNITEVNLRQIGVGRSEGEPCVPLLIKSLFTCMFWVTLRQRVQEIRQRRQSAVITDMAAPLQLTVSAAASGEYDTQLGAIHKLRHTLQYFNV